MLGIIDSDATTTSEAPLVLDRDLTAQSSERSFLTSLEMFPNLQTYPKVSNKNSVTPKQMNSATF